MQQVIDGIRNVHLFNTSGMFLDPNGKNPVCIPGVGTGICEHCGQYVELTRGNACPSVPPESRWSIRCADGGIA